MRGSRMNRYYDPEKHICYGAKVVGTPCDRWPYKSLTDPEYIKDRDECFRRNGNGWWYLMNMSDKFTRKGE
jgi:hypothetical protein